MEYNSVIPLHLRPSFAEGTSLSSDRDERNVALNWKKDREIERQLQSLVIGHQRLSREFSKQRRKPLGGFVPNTAQAQIDFADAFQIYTQTPNDSYTVNATGSNYVDGDIVTIAGGSVTPGGQPTTLKLHVPALNGGILFAIEIVTAGNYTVEPTFPNSPTGGSGTGLQVTKITANDQYRCIQIRSGLVGIRSRFFPVTQQTFNLYRGLQNAPAEAFGNFQNIIQVFGDALPPYFKQEVALSLNQFPGISSVMLGALDTPVLIQGYDSSGFARGFSQIIINATADRHSHYAAFWLEIVDDPAKPTAPNPLLYINLWGQMYKDDGSDFPFPPCFANSSSTANTNVIPIGIVDVNSGSDPVTAIGQFLTGSVINTYDGYYNKNLITGSTNGLACGANMVFRGDWTNDSLTNQYFYPGDIVRDISPAGSALTNTVYVCLIYGQKTVAPNIDTTNWLPISY